MPTLKIYVGLPGSGKSHRARGFIDGQPEGAKSLLYNDPFNYNFFKHQNKDLGSLIRTLKSGRNCIVCDVNFCFAANRDMFATFMHSIIEHLVIDWRFFVNDPATCIRNINGDVLAEKSTPEHRDARMAALNAVTAHYHPPGGPPVPIAVPNVYPDLP